MTARATDPQTSHDAAIGVASKLPTLKAAFLQALREIGPATANEIARHATKAGVSANAESVRKRATELVNAKTVRWAGVKVCSVTGERARTVELVNEIGNRNTLPKADRQASTNDFGQRPADSESRQSVRSQLRNDLPNKEAAAVSTPEADRIRAVAEFMRHEREWRFIPEVANEMFHLAKMGAWPAGDSNDYIAAVEAAAAGGLIERHGSNVRAVKVVKESKVVQQDLF